MARAPCDVRRCPHCSDHSFCTICGKEWLEGETLNACGLSLMTSISVWFSRQLQYLIATIGAKGRSFDV